MQTITIAPPKRSWFSLLSWAVVLAVLVVSWQLHGVMPGVIGLSR